MSLKKNKTKVTENIMAEKSTENFTDDTKKLLLLAHEMKIARSLSCNDKVLRDRALKSLRKFFQTRYENMALTEADFLTIWNGLFHSVWMSDKPLIQEKCVEDIASLLHVLPLDYSLTFFKCGLLTLCKRWFGMDQLRLDKFLMFVRRLLRQILIVLRNSGFLKEHIIKFGDILIETVLDVEKRDILGLFLHFTDIFLEELAKVTGGKLKPFLMTEFLMPFIKTMAKTDDPRRLRQIKNSIFIQLMVQSDVGLEYQEKYEAWKMLGFPGTIHAMQKMEVDDSTNEETEEVMDVDSDSKPMDPRAGRVDVELPQIRFDPKVLADLLIKYKYSDGSTVAAKKTMTLLSKQMKKLSKGIYPLGVTDLRLPKQDDTKIRKAVNRLVKFEKKLKQGKRESRKRKLPRDDVEPKKMKTDNCETNTESDSVSLKKLDFDEIPKEYLQKGIVLKGKSAIKEALPESLLSDSGELPELVFEKFSGLWKVYDESEKPKLNILKKKKPTLKKRKPKESKSE